MSRIKAWADSLLAFRCAFCYQRSTTKYDQDGIGMKYLGLMFTGFFFWFGNFFGLPDRGDVC